MALQELMRLYARYNGVEMARKWIKIGAGAGIGITSIVAFFQVLAMLYGFQITDVTGNVYCNNTVGSFEGVCVSDFDVRNPNAYYVDIYNKDEVKMEFSPSVKTYSLFVKDGRCKECISKEGLWFKGWRPVDFTNETKPLQNKKYVFRFPAYTTKHFRVAGIKHDPDHVIKWTFGVADGELDPVWLRERTVTRDYTYEIISKPRGGYKGEFYSGAVNGYEDSEWKTLEELRSYKEGFNGTDYHSCIVEEDENHSVRCLDWNMTHRLLSTKFKNKNLSNQIIPIKIYNPDGTLNKTKTAKYVPITLSNNLDEEIRLIKADENDIVHIGETSVEIRLNATAGDGEMRVLTTYTNWDLVHDATQGWDTDTSTEAVLDTTRSQITSRYDIGRGFFPIDTSAIPDDITIRGANLTLYLKQSDNDPDTDRYAYYTIIGNTSQASTNSLGINDYNDCGPVDNPTEFSTVYFAFENVTYNRYYHWNFTFNSDGIAAIDKTGISMFGLRDGHDIVDDPIATGKDDDVSVRFSEYAGTAFDPHLNVDWVGDAPPEPTSNVTMVGNDCYFDGTKGDAIHDQINCTIMTWNCTNVAKIRALLNVSTHRFSDGKNCTRAWWSGGKWGKIS